MRIGILTYYNVHNHGAVLQANALKTVLEKMGHEVCFLTFNRNYDYIPITMSKKYSLSVSSIPFYIKYALKRGLKNILYNVIKNKKLKKYKKVNFSMGDRYSQFDGDFVVVGSDEVFSFEIGINPCFFGHGISVKNIMSYAASFGPTNETFIKEHGLDGVVKSGLSKFLGIGVRDENSKSIIENIAYQTPSLVCDPVILYGYIEELNSYKPKDKKYLLIYSYDKNMNSKEEIDAIKQYAKKNNLKIYSVGYYHKWCDKNINVSPIELLGYVKNAEFVVTDTFHGTVISIISNTDMIVKIRGNSNKLIYLLQEYNLMDRVINDFCELKEKCKQHINFSEVNNIIEQKRNNSIEFLKEAIKK